MHGFTLVYIYIYVFLICPYPFWLKTCSGNLPNLIVSFADTHLMMDSLMMGYLMMMGNLMMGYLMMVSFADMGYLMMGYLMMGYLIMMMGYLMMGYLAAPRTRTMQTQSPVTYTSLQGVMNVRFKPLSEWEQGAWELV